MPDVEKDAGCTCPDLVIDPVCAVHGYATDDEVGCGNCGLPLTDESGYTGWVAYHRECARQVYGDTFEEVRARVITLCGSTRFKSEFESWNSRLTLDGNVVISVGVFGHAYHPYHREKYLAPRKPMLDRLHLQKINMADEIFVIDPGGYIGESTAREIEYAKATRKPVRRLSEEDPTCATCGRDNRNGTHTALERTGHLSHPFTTTPPTSGDQR